MPEIVTIDERGMEKTERVKVVNGKIVDKRWPKEYFFLNRKLKDYNPTNVSGNTITESSEELQWDSDGESVDLGLDDDSLASAG